MLPTVARIFVSSTWLDLQPERHAVEDAINRMNAGKFVGMEYFGSRPESTEGASLEEVDRSDLYVGIIGGRYGSGITEKEYLRARERDLPCFIYFKDDRVVTAEGRDKEAEKTKLLDVFKLELTKNHIVATPFTTPTELAICIRDDLYRWFERQRAAELARVAAGDIVTTRDDHRSMRLQVGAAEGGLVYDGMATQPRPRPTPVRPSVRPFRGLLDRGSESEAALQTLPELAPMEFYGQSGIGKTALLRHLAYNTPDGHFPDGVIYRDQVGRQPSADLLQFLFDSLYESERNYKPREAELLNLLRGKRALVLLDDVDLPRDEIERAMNAAPECAFLLSSEERHIFGEGRALRLQGLPDPEATQLLERELGRLLAPGEQVAAQAICALLEGHPLHIAQAVAAAQERKLPLGELAEKMRAAKAKGQNPADLLNQWMIESDSDDEKRAMAAMAALDGAPARAETLAALSGISDFEATLEKLTKRKLVETRVDGYRLTGPLQTIMQKDRDLTEWRDRALAYLTAWAEEQRRDHRGLERVSAALLSVFNWALRNGRWDEAKRLGRALDVALTLSGRWEAWGQVLQQVGEAASAVGDEETAAWVLHQQGSRALCLGDDEAARRYLTEAMERRAAMGDHAAASITRHNLDWLFPTVPFTPPEPSGQSVSTTVSRRGNPGSIPGWLKFLGAASLAGLGGWFFWPEAKPQFTPERLSFLNQPLNQQSAQQTVTLTNPGAKELAIDEMRIDGAAASDFTIAGDDCRGRRLARGEKCSVSLFFTPRDAGGREARLKLIGRPADLLPELTLSGVVASTPTPSPTSLAGSSVVAPTPIPSPTSPEAQPNPLNFGKVELGRNAVQSVTLTNTGAAPLKIGAASFNDDQFNEFRIDQNGCQARDLSQGDRCTIRVIYTPQGSGERRATLIIADNTPAHRMNVALNGFGVKPAAARASVTPSQLEFGDLEVGGRAIKGTVTLTSVGEAPLQITSVRLEVNSLFRIATDGCANRSIVPKQSCGVSIIFSPGAVGPHRSTLLIESNAAESPHRIEISGRAIKPVRPPKLTITPRNLDFGNVTAGKTLTVCLRNDGEAALQISEITLAGADPGDFKLSPDCANSALQPGQECRINLTFTPQVRAGRANQDRFSSASLVVRHNAVGGQDETRLSGAAKRAQPKSRFDLTPNQWDFGRLQVDARSQAQSFRLTNRGEEPFIVASVRINESVLGSLLGRDINKGATNQGSSNFNIENRCNGTLNPGSACEIVVRFMPRLAGKLRGTLQISIGDSFATASLSGVGVGAQPQPRRAWCCVSGRIEDLDARECQRRKGASYPDEASARRGCSQIR
jgi:Domain of unknown function (DUF4062)/Abnormal spindle-like microcephaly-assoc'd, ASPM-SPD-2-Hydin/NB-ARC domain